MKTINLKISKCSECPFKRANYEGMSNYSNSCFHKDVPFLKNNIIDIKTIPEWCPLLDYKEST